MSVCSLQPTRDLLREGMHSFGETSTQPTEGEWKWLDTHADPGRFVGRRDRERRLPDFGRADRLAVDGEGGGAAGAGL